MFSVSVVCVLFVVALFSLLSSSRFIHRVKKLKTKVFSCASRARARVSGHDAACSIRGANPEIKVMDMDKCNGRGQVQWTWTSANIWANIRRT